MLGMANAPKDPDLLLARGHMRLYKQARFRAKGLTYASDIGTLMSTGATTLTAALHGAAWATTTLAAASFCLVGIRRYLRPGENWIRVSNAIVDLERAIVHFEAIPDSERTPMARAGFRQRVLTIRETEHAGWLKQRRALEAAADHDAGISAGPSGS